MDDIQKFMDWALAFTGGEARLRGGEDMREARARPEVSITFPNVQLLCRLVTSHSFLPKISMFHAFSRTAVSSESLTTINSYLSPNQETRGY